MKKNTYSDFLCEWLVEEGYTHCFFVAGGQIMHLLNSARNRFQCVPVVHEVTAAIATEYFNETSNGAKAFALVTSGPGITNAVTGVAGAWLESRELLIIGGQVKSSDLMTGGIRQRGIQEIDGISLLKGITKISKQFKSTINKNDFKKIIRFGADGRPGPIFLEICLDVQGSTGHHGKFLDETTELNLPELNLPELNLPELNESNFKELLNLITNAERPILLIGGGVKRKVVKKYQNFLESLGLPIMTTWNGIDRFPSNHKLFWGRPNTWGQRSSNVLIQQSDLVIAIGTRLGLQQTGFNWKAFAPNAKKVQVEIDSGEIFKGHPEVNLMFNCSAEDFLNTFHKLDIKVNKSKVREWLDFGRIILKLLPNNETSNSKNVNFFNPYDFVEILSTNLTSSDVIIPCSSGGAFTTIMQAFEQKSGQIIVSNKGLASMGYGLPGAIGAAYANPHKRIILVEGDGGFAQNLQEIGTAVASNFPIKIFIYVNNGYASIRTTQKNYFNGAYIGCDVSTGLGLPDWVKLFSAYKVDTMDLTPQSFNNRRFLSAMNDSSPRAFLVPIDPEQTYYPKITSRVLESGQMESNPLHLMTPSLTDELQSEVFKYL